MYRHPEMARMICAQRIQEFHARAEADRLVAQARSGRRPGRSWTARIFRLARRATVRRPALGYPAPRKV